MLFKKAFHILIFGRVQGVGFRFFVQEKASEYSVQGWVRNMPNSCVEVRVEGKTENLEKFIVALKEGPTSARVDNFKINEVTPESLSNFTIKI